jgi:hypothetical protein
MLAAERTGIKHVRPKLGRLRHPPTQLSDWRGGIDLRIFEQSSRQQHCSVIDQDSTERAEILRMVISGKTGAAFISGNSMAVDWRDCFGEIIAEYHPS